MCIFTYYCIAYIILHLKSKIPLFGLLKTSFLYYPSFFSIISLQAMFIENIFLLLASSWMFSMVSWDTVGIPAAVFCSFLIGETPMCAVKKTTLFRPHPGVGGGFSMTLICSVLVFSETQVLMQVETSRSS